VRKRTLQTAVKRGRQRGGSKTKGGFETRPYTFFLCVLCG
jgi:hypothetical protein